MKTLDEALDLIQDSNNTPERISGVFKKHESIIEEAMNNRVLSNQMIVMLLKTTTSVMLRDDITTLRYLWFCLTLGLTLGIEMEKAE